jgi:two-component sensor histidine kinase
MVLLVNTAPVYSRGKITGTVSFGKDITDRKLMENKLKTSLKEKEILLSELYHRTKNNMQVISSMLVLQATVCNDENVKRVINNVTVKIKAMSLVHQKLFQSKDLSNIKLKEYIGEVVQVIIQIYEKNNKVTVEEKIDDISVLIDIATPLGLIISELVSNSFKHAFSKDKNGIIKINIFKDSKNNIEIRYSDNGGGLTDNFDFESTKCLGLKIIKDLVRYQLQGNIDYINDGGFVCIIRFLDNLYKQRV